MARKSSFKSPSSSTVQVRLHRDAKTGNWIAKRILSKDGKLMVKGGPVTGGESRAVIKPMGETKLKPHQLSKLINHMKLPG